MDCDLKDAYIYGLIDPMTDQLRYIGKSVNVNRRYRRHITERFLHDSYKDRWIRKLINENNQPELLIIDKVQENEWKFWEQHYISYFKGIGCLLTNGTNGGDQPPSTKGRRHKESSKLKMSRSKIGKTIPWLNDGRLRTESHKQNLSKSLKGRASPNKDKKLTEDWKKNLSVAHDSQKKRVNQLDRNGNLIQGWDSINLAQKTLEIRHISECCRKKKYHKTSGGFKWEYEN